MKRLCLLALAFCALGCERSRPPPPAPEVEPEASSPFVPPEGFTRLRLSSTPYLDPDHLLHFHAPLADYLSSWLKVPVEIVRADNYDRLGELMRKGEVDLGSYSPLSYVRAKAVDPGLQPVVNFISEGSATSAGYIVVRAEGALKTLEDLRGARFAWVDPSSTSGFLFPRALLRQRGLDPDTFFSHSEFLGNHEAALMAVHEGRFDATATFQGALPALQRSNGVDPLSFRIVAKTLRTPKDVFCARSGLPQEVVAQLRLALLSLSARTEEGRRVLGPLHVNGFIPADDHLYHEVRRVEAQLQEGR